MKIDRDRYFDRDGNDHHVQLSASFGTQRMQTSALIDRLPQASVTQIEQIIAAALDKIADVLVTAPLEKRQWDYHGNTGVVRDGS
jgi:CRISPR/Cas system-associated endoribonuclease Cas2